MTGPPPADTPPWRVGGFTEVRELGAGAQGRVVLARHAGTGAPVAIKYLDRRDGDERAVESLRAEAVMLGRVDDPHVVRLYRFVSAERGVALVMEAVNGVSLKRILAEHGALEPEAALTVLKGSLRGLAAAHAAGVVHRDYKPANVVVRADGLSKLIDFGVAVLAGDGGGSGTPAYMAPEQWEKRPASPATDVYAATCVFYECVTGRRPYGGDLAALAGAHLRASVPVEQVPAALRDLIARGMAKSADDRPAGAADFVAELDAVASSVYGSDWEGRGVRAMAGAAVAVAAVFPLVAAGLAPAGGAAAGTAAAGTGTAVGVTAGGGVSAAVAAKAAGAVIAATAVAAGGAGVYAASTGDEASRADGPRVLQVRPVSFTRTSSGPSTRVTARVPQLSGLPGGLAARVNALVRAPAERWARSAGPDLAAFRPRDDPANPYTGKVEYDVGLKGPKLFSVRYTFSGTVMTRNTPAVRVVTVDLTTGRALAGGDFFRSDALTGPRMSALTRLLAEYGPGHGALCDEGPFWDEESRRYVDTPPASRDLTPALVNEGVLHMLPTRQGIVFYPPVSRMGYSMACGRQWRPFHVPYRRLGRYIRPDVIRAAGAAVPSP
ncbi:serine/threonine-protein kinase [Actinomadura sp. NAK00032]|uniref:serine/threonine-protein kinase n=1 Tax=Actinomadura sp. NAK00032 TaxID=2742128 RepID=UPI001C376567|nr:serine/threonine-protein kinase [Actinomadura sp. NAK00032]